MQLLRLLIPLGFFCCLSAQADCPSHHEDVAVEHKSASAGVLANFFNRTGSLRYEFDRILVAIDAQFANSTSPEGICSAGCTPSIVPQIVASSIPEKFLESYEGKEDCDQLYKNTLIAPITYHDRRFASVHEFADWFSDFSQGDGTDGENLYSICIGVCSPQYVSVLTKIDSGYSANVEVVCGPARDKDDNHYRVAVSYRWWCQGKDKPRQIITKAKGDH